jgi:hypothetical protein
MLFGCASHLSGQSGQQTEVRQPAAGESLEEFWDAFDWQDLSAGEQKLWGVLGWDEGSWQEETEPPASEDKFWAELNEDERNAAQELGYEAGYWDHLLRLKKTKATK